jgi:hypothetical protein
VSQPTIRASRKNSAPFSLRVDARDPQAFYYGMAAEIQLLAFAGTPHSAPSAAAAAELQGSPGTPMAKASH